MDFKADLRRLNQLEEHLDHLGFAEELKPKRQSLDLTLVAPPLEAGLSNDIAENPVTETPRIDAVDDPEKAEKTGVVEPLVDDPKSKMATVTLDASKGDVVHENDTLSQADITLETQSTDTFSLAQATNTDNTLDNGLTLVVEKPEFLISRAVTLPRTRGERGDRSIPNVEERLLEEPILSRTPSPTKSISPSKESMESQTLSRTPSPTKSLPSKESLLDSVIVTTTGVSFPMASQRRNADLHVLFPTLDPEDCLVEDFACAWRKDVLLQGRLYLTVSHVCFYAKIIWTYSLILPYTEITNIEKKSVAGIFPNAIELSTESAKYFFATFMARDNTFDYLNNLTKGVPNHVKVLRQQSTEEFELDRIKRRPSFLTGNDLPHPPKLNLEMSRNVTPSSKGLAELALSESKPEITLPIDSPYGIVHQKHQVLSPTSLPPLTKRSISSPTSSQTQRVPFSCDCNTEKLDMIQLHTLDFDCTVSTIWTLLFSYDSFTSGFMKSFYDSRKHSQFKLTDWSSSSSQPQFPDPLGSRMELGKVKPGYTRKLSYITPLNNSLGPKQTTCEVDETIVNNDFFYICVNAVSMTPDVPAGGTFKTHARVCLETLALGPNNNTRGGARLKLLFKIEYVSSTWLKAVLDRAVKDGIKSYYVDLCAEITKYLKDHPDLEVSHGLFEAAVLPSVVAPPVLDKVEPRKVGWLHVLIGVVIFQSLVILVLLVRLNKSALFDSVHDDL